MKYILKFLMMFIAYNAFAQSNNNQQKRHIITLQNGDEDITIIEDSEKNVIQLTTTDDSSRYNMLDLSNHEVKHRSTKKRGIIRADFIDQNRDDYTVEGSDRNHPGELEDENEDTSGA